MRTVAEIEALIQSDTLNHIIADQIESQDLDFKEWSYRAPSEKDQLKDNYKKILHMAVCMANGGGGHIVFGVVDDKIGKEQALLGVPVDLDLNNIITNVYQKTEPRIQVQARKIYIEYGTGTLLIISVTGETPPYTQSDGSGSTRQGTDCVPLTGTIRRQMIQRHIHFDYSNELLDGKWCEYVSASAMEYIRDNMQKQHSPQDLVEQSDYELLQTIGAVRDNQLTRGGLLLVGKSDEIHRHIPTHQWAYRKMKSDTDYIYREEGFDSIAIAARELEKNIQRDNELMTVEVGLFHHEYATYPTIAIREALMNALAHRDYELTGAVMVKQYPDRLEISNPGNFLAGISPDNILHHASTPRNIHLMNLLDRVRLVNRTNLGVPRIYEALLREGKEPPSYQDSGAQITLIMLASEITPAFQAFVENEKNANNYLGVDDLLVLQYLLKHSKATLHELAAVIQRSSDMAKEKTSQLVSNLILEKVGTGTGQFYILSQRVSVLLKGGLAYERNHELDEERVKLQILSYMQKNKKMTRSDIIQMTGWDKNKVYRFMIKLREEGLVKNIGRGIGAHYILNKEE